MSQSPPQEKSDPMGASNLAGDQHKGMSDAQQRETYFESDKKQTGDILGSEAGDSVSAASDAASNSAAQTQSKSARDRGKSA